MARYTTFLINFPIVTIIDKLFLKNVCFKIYLMSCSEQTSTFYIHCKPIFLYLYTEILIIVNFISIKRKYIQLFLMLYKYSI